MKQLHQASRGPSAPPTRGTRATGVSGTVGVPPAEAGVPPDSPDVSPLSRRLRTAFLATLVLITASTLEAAPNRTFAPETLVPGNMQPVTDDKGNQWSVNNYGFLQNTGNSFFNNILMLHLNGQQFYNYQPLMTPDGKEFVLPGQQPLMGLQIMRRIRLLEKDGVMRYLDLFTNPGTSPVSVTVEYRNNFSSPVKAITTDRGMVNPGSLGKGETGVVVTSKQNGQKAVLLTLGAPQSKLKPTFGQRGQYEGNFSFALTVPAGQSVALCYSVSLVPAPPENDKVALARIFKGLPAAKLLKTLRREDLAVLANFAASSGGEPSALLTSGGLDSLDVERGKADVLAMGDKTRLTGTASCGDFTVTTTFGATGVPFERVAALVGGSRGGGRTRLFLRDGQVFSGEVKASDLRFAMPSGARVDLDLATLDRLVRKPAADEGKWEPGAVAMLVTFQGDQIALGDGPATFECTTPWGPLACTLDDILWFGPNDDGVVGHHIEFKDGSRFFGFLSGAPVAVQTRLFGPQTFAPVHIRGVVTATALTRSKDDKPDLGTPDQPHVLLSGGQRLLGQFETDTITVLTGAKVVEIPPAGIRSLRNVREETEVDTLEADSPPFQIELWGGGTIVGQLREPVLALRVRNTVWRVPSADLLELHNPSPRVSDEMRLKIAGLIRDLGNDDWEKRESASQALGQFGFMAKALFEEALKTTPDPEVRRRVEQLIDDLE